MIKKKLIFLLIFFLQRNISMRTFELMKKIKQTEPKKTWTERSIAKILRGKFESKTKHTHTHTVKLLWINSK